MTYICFSLLLSSTKNENNLSNHPLDKKIVSEMNLWLINVLIVIKQVQIISYNQRKRKVRNQLKNIRLKTDLGYFWYCAGNKNDNPGACNKQ